MRWEARHPGHGLIPRISPYKEQQRSAGRIYHFGISSDKTLSLRTVDGGRHRRGRGSRAEWGGSGLGIAGEAPPPETAGASRWLGGEAADSSAYALVP